MRDEGICVEGALVHNLQNVSCTIPHQSLCCLTGVSGSGKSSFAFDTVFIEGQRRYLQSLSHQAKRIVGGLPRPDVKSIVGLTPTIAIEQKTTVGSPRSTVGTITEIYDFLRVLYAKESIPHCPVSGEAVVSQTRQQIIDAILSRRGKKLMVLVPYVQGKKGALKESCEELERKGFSKVRLDGKLLRISEIELVEKNKSHTLEVVVDSIEVGSQQKNRILSSVNTALDLGKGALILYDPDAGEEDLFSEHAYSKKSGQSYSPLDPQDFSFNHPSGMCPECEGRGETRNFILDRIIDGNKTIREGFCSVAGSYDTVFYRNVYDNLSFLYGFSIDTQWKNLSETVQHILLYGTDRKWTRMTFINPNTGATWINNVQWQGILHDAKGRYNEAKGERYKRQMERYMHLSVCQACAGSRLRPYPAAARLRGVTIHQLVSMTIEKVISFFDGFVIEERKYIQEIVDQIRSRLYFLNHVGLGYLTLDRTATTLSGGEFQRVRLASQVGSGLVGITYVLDEPSIGLHACDNEKLIQSLRHLRDRGNTVIVVEHDESMIRSADWLLDFGPGAGPLGGKLLYQGPLPALEGAKDSLTAEYLFGRKLITREHKRRDISKKRLVIQGASLHNLQQVDLSIPIGAFVAITGVSGSGKSSLILETLYPALVNKFLKTDMACGPYTQLQGVEHLDKVIHIDQTPIGRTPRSNPATYSGVFDDIRDLFASLVESKAKGWTAGRFSFNVKEGSCPVCSGMGYRKVDMDFLEEAWVECTACGGKRFESETLSVQYKGKTIADVLDMSCSEALTLFETIPTIRKGLEILCQVGLDYLRLGQSSTTLSGGEAQRLKIAKELAKPKAPSTLYLLDEPTTGLHFHDLNKLLHVLHELVDRGHTVVVIEHNLDLVKTADWVIDMGPGAGAAGGTIIAQGSPELIATMDTPTGRALRESTRIDPFYGQQNPLAIHGTDEESTSARLLQHNEIQVRGARQNNLRNLTLRIPHNKLIALIGPSGVGKSSLALETLFAEGQRQYIESLSPYARQFIKQLPRPYVDSIQGLPPTVALEQRHHASNPRSTVGTITEIYDYARIFWAHAGIAHCPKTGAVIQEISKDRVVDVVLSWPSERIILLAPVTIGTTLDKVLDRLRQNGYSRIRLDGVFIDLDDSKPSAGSRLEIVVDRVTPSVKERERLLNSVGEAARLGGNTLIIVRGKQDVFFNLSFAVEETGESYPPITAQTFAFNTQQGMCDACRGIGRIYGLDITSLHFSRQATVSTMFEKIYSSDFESFFPNIKTMLTAIGIPPSTLLSDLTMDQRKKLLQGSPLEIKKAHSPLRFEYRGCERALEAVLGFRGDDGVEKTLPAEWKGAIRERSCESCGGTRLNPLARNVLVGGIGIADFCHKPIREAFLWFQKERMTSNLPKTLHHVADEIASRLNLAVKLQMGYLSLDRMASTLSSGEAQRVQLVSQLGSGLSGLLYVIDEPSVGLHPHDIKPLLQVFDEVTSYGNTLLMIEHDPAVFLHADTIIELGDHGGVDGGKVVFEGSSKEFLQSKSTLTSLYVQEKRILSSRPLKKNQPISLRSITKHNLIDFSCDIPTAALVGIVGVAGSGKSTLLSVVEEGMRAKLSSLAINEHITGLNFSYLVSFDQKPFSHTSRSDVATYMELATVLRARFSRVDEAVRRGIQSSEFSPYTFQGMCKECLGLGYKRVDMYFLAPVRVPCECCQGLRLNQQTLSIELYGYNLGKMLQLSITEVAKLFAHDAEVLKYLNSLLEVDLGYLTLGHEMASLSHGEAQRVKIARELAKTRKYTTLYLMDEPTIGLHMDEVQTVIRQLLKLKEKHTVIVIEHNLDVIAACDYLLELGSGKIIATGTPAQLKESLHSVTGRYL